MASFNRGFVQGSGVGPTLFVILALDLNTLSGTNELIKFADDSTLLGRIHIDIGHGLSTEHVLSELRKKTFINMMIFSNCY